MIYFSLEAYDENSNFGNSTESTSSGWQMSTPAATTYADVTGSSGLPTLTADTVASYLTPLHTKLGKKSQELYSERYIQFFYSYYITGYYSIPFHVFFAMNRLDTC